MKGHINGETIALLAGGDLKAGEMRSAAAHLAECPSCSAEFDRYRRNCQAMADIRDVGISANDLEDIRRSVLECLSKERSARFPFFKWYRTMPLQRAALAAMLLAVVAIGIYIREKSNTPQPIDTGAKTENSPGKPIPPPMDTPVDIPAKAIPAQTADNRGEAPRHRRATLLSSAPPSRAAVVNPQTEPRPEELQDDVAIKLETSDPNVIIIWLKSPKGGDR